MSQVILTVWALQKAHRNTVKKESVRSRMSVFVGYSFLRTSLLEVTISFCPPSESVESVDTAMYRRVILLEWFTPSKLSVMEPFVFGCLLGSFIFFGA